MPVASRIALSKGLRMGFLIAGVVGIATVALAWLQAQRERRIDLEDLDRRMHLVTHQIKDSVHDALRRPESGTAKLLADQLEGHRRLLGFAVFGPDGRRIASGKAVAEFTEEMKPALLQALAGKSEAIATIRAQDTNLQVLATRLTNEDGALQGVLVAVHEMSHLDERAAMRMVHFAYWILLITFLLIILVVGVTWAAYERPLKNLAEWMRRLRTDNAPEAPPTGLPVALLASETERLAASFRAARLQVSTDSRSITRDHKLWTRERLRAQAVDCLQGGQLVVVSNREPYMHQLRDGKPRLIVPAGGLVTALDPILQACGGLWVAHGAGDADRQTADAGGRLTVPPDDGRYTLRRVWLSREEEQGYYYGLSNEGLWPLCHLAHERPTFRASDWDHYVEANRRFTAAILEEIGSSEATVLVQDFHLALVPHLLKLARPDIRVGVFWHIPWPNPEAFRICPWRAEILKGILGADLVGFHLQQYCNNFLDTVDRMVEARLDWDHFAVELGGRRSLVRPFPISIESWAERGVPLGDALTRQTAQLQERYKLDYGPIIVGVDRVDYTKGLPERLRAVGRFFEKYPQHRRKLTFVQLAAPSRTHLRRYRELIVELESLADEINWKFQAEDWKPIHFLVDHHDAATVHAFLRMASVCLVSSLHDGMNLVAKEFVAAKPEEDGVLVLSEFAGAARELSDALIINPYDTEQFADTIHAAVEMDVPERRARMQRMRQVVEEHNVYWWAATFLTELSATRTSDLRNSGQFELPKGLKTAGVHV
ncbi:MAG: trehalose-6-phosphate synthase [Gemmataceae bacterium]|nr:trehalose-6-phosphate synthase [Gemmataceae bacterium]MCI0738729.1 trehalose-6-phosphate synthase [Gemmataceae bacterium]